MKEGIREENICNIIPVYYILSLLHKNTIYSMKVWICIIIIIVIYVIVVYCFV